MAMGVRVRTSQVYRKIKTQMKSLIKTVKRMVLNMVSRKGGKFIWYRQS